MILLPKYKTIHPNGAIASADIGVSGEFRFVKHNSMGQVNYDSGWKSNRWLDQGMDQWATRSNDIFNTMSLGDSDDAIVDTQISLQGSHLGWSQTAGPGNGVINLGSAPDWESTYNSTKRFNPGVATGTVREVVTSHLYAPAGNDAHIRAIVSPAIVKASDETLDVYYRWTMWPPVIDTDSTAVIDSLTYDTKSRIYDVDRITNVNPHRIPGIGLGSGSHSKAWGDGADLIAIDANSGWGGTSDNGDTTAEFVDTYVPSNHYLDWYINIPLDGWNTGSGIRVAAINAASYNVQVKFTRQGGGGETVPKDNTMVIEDVYWRFGWARH